MARLIAPLVLAAALAVSPGSPAAIPVYEAVDVDKVVAPFRAEGIGAGEELGEAIAFGNVVGDDRDDLVVSALAGDGPAGQDAGAVFVVDAERVLGEIDLAAAASVQIHGAQAFDRTGNAVAVGDFNDDGFGDVAVGAPDLFRNDAPASTVYIVWGQAALPAVIPLANPGVDVTEITDPNIDIFGLPTKTALGDALDVGDFDGDGIDDLMIGAPLWNLGQFGEDVGRVYIVYGQPDFNQVTSLNLGQASDNERLIIQGGQVPGFAGTSVTAVDFDGDGLVDCGLGAPGVAIIGAGANNGESYVVYGRGDRPSPIFVGPNPGGPVVFTTIFTDVTSAPQGFMGQSIAAGHFTTDLQEDLLIGAPGDDVDPTFPGAAFLVRGQSPRVGSIFLNTTPGFDHAVFLGTNQGDLFGEDVAMVDLDGNGLEDPVIAAPGYDPMADPPGSDRGGVFIRRSFGFFPFGAEVLDETSPDTWSFLGRPGGTQPVTVERGDLNHDVIDDLLIGSALRTGDGGEANQGEVIAFTSILTYPRLVGVTVVEEESADQMIQPGDQLLLTYDRAVTVTPTTLNSSDIFLTNRVTNRGVTIGSDARIEPSADRPNVLVITLGETFNGIEVFGDDPAFSTALEIAVDNGLDISDPVTDMGAIDGGVAFVDDVGVDLRWRFGGDPQLIGPDGSFLLGVLQNQRGVIDFEYTAHQLFFPRESLAAFFTFSFDGLPMGFGTRGLASAFRISTDRDPHLPFLRPLTLTFEYRDEDIDFFSGQIEGLVLPFQVDDEGFLPLIDLPAVQAARTSSAWAPAPILLGAATQDPEENTIEVEVDSLDPEGAATPGLFATLPVNPVEERSINIAPSTTAGASVQISLPVRNGVSSTSLSPAAGSGYLLHTLEFPGFEAVGGADPNRTEVTIRQANLFERIHPAPQVGANLFPTQSGSVFVIETADSGGSPTAFTDPVNMSVQFIERDSDTLTDLVDFASVVGANFQMRIVRSRVDNTLGPDYQHIADAQGIDPGAGLVMGTSISDLTDANGQAAWGTVIDGDVAPPTITLQEIIDHILGVNVLTDQLKLDLADQNNDGPIDAGDIVMYIETH